VHSESTSRERASGTGAFGVARLSPRRVPSRYLVDLALLLISLWLARWLRLVLPIGRALDPEGYALHWPMVLVAVLVWSVSLAAARVYPVAGRRDAIGELQGVVAAITVATLVYAGVLYLSYRGLSRLLYGYFYLLDLGLTTVAHLLWRHHDRRDGRDRRRVALLGTSPEVLQLARTIEQEGRDQFTIVGLIADGAGALSPGDTAPPVLGHLVDLLALLQTYALDELVIGADRPVAEVEELLHTLQALPVALTLVPRTAQLVLSRAAVESLGDLVLIGLNAPVIAPLDRALKRALDLLIATVALVLLAPLLALISLAILADSRGPVIYRSRRLGEGERPFVMYKFRTMMPDAEREQESLISTGTAGELSFAKRRDDPRVTRMGRVLRRWSLDELPQLLNVLRGQMSLVGPRPELPGLAIRYAPWQRRRFGVPQGMTGWWQISGRSELPKALHVEDDLHYIRNYSLLLDLEILWRTIGAVLRGKGAY
jgi:exopolysaccharide biosynthesis polyprenyl glycosylphosphotransferase